ncbi:BLUF domain-containing protein [Sphingomonas sp. 3P27F8]|uniref:BLUF domain-containing protein n=1 Tax=Sphingomonas sp. 3P27F8 TaxID=2502213 RepID=UPI0010F7CA06|nr:BLUF domain-containing protein [Sphingomonas sp. 3P27F8]
MERLLYISTARQVLDPQELNDILRRARRSNAALDVTGLLAVGGRRFLQLLEGPAEGVAQIYDRIRQDPRHFAIVKLSHKVVDSRQTAGWAMAYHEPHSGKLLQDIVAELISEIKDPTLGAEFAHFARRHAA